MFKGKGKKQESTAMKHTNILQQNMKHCNLHLHQHESSTDKCVKKVKVNIKYFVYTAMLNFVSVLKNNAVI
jgi:hypothetical protein